MTTAGTLHLWRARRTSGVAAKQLQAQTAFHPLHSTRPDLEYFLPEAHCPLSIWSRTGGFTGLPSVLMNNCPCYYRLSKPLAHLLICVKVLITVLHSVQIDFCPVDCEI